MFLAGCAHAPPDVASLATPTPSPTTPATSASVAAPPSGAPSTSSGAAASAASSGTAGVATPADTASGAVVDPAAPWANRTDLIQAPPPPQAAALAIPPLERWTQPNGLQVLVVRRTDLPIASFTVTLRAGGHDETRAQLGVADFVAAMLRKGTRAHSADAISRIIDDVGGSLAASADAESTTVDCSVMARDADRCIDLLAEVLMRPTFPETEMAEVRDETLAELAARLDDPHQIAGEAFDHMVFGDQHPDGWVQTPADVKRLTRADLVAFWRRFYRPNNAVLAIAGDVDMSSLRRRLQRAFGGWSRGVVPVRVVPPVPPAPPTHVLLVDKPELTQATLMFGHPGIKHADPDWYATTLVNYVLGGSDFSSRLMTEVRSRRGLTYGIGSYFGAPATQGAFRVSAATRTETTLAALRVAEGELRRMRDQGPTADELAKAKGYYAGSTPFSLESAEGMAAAIVRAERHGLGVDYVRDLALRFAAVDKAAADAGARAHLHPGHLAIVIVGRADAIAPQLRAANLPFTRVTAHEALAGDGGSAGGN